MPFGVYLSNTLNVVIICVNVRVYVFVCVDDIS